MLWKKRRNQSVCTFDGRLFINRKNEKTVERYCIQPPLYLILKNFLFQREHQVQRPIEILSFTFTASETVATTTANTIINVTIIFLPFLQFQGTSSGSCHYYPFIFELHCKVSAALGYGQRNRGKSWPQLELIILYQESPKKRSQRFSRAFMCQSCICLIVIWLIVSIAYLLGFQQQVVVVKCIDAVGSRSCQSCQDASTHRV